MGTLVPKNWDVFFTASLLPSVNIEAFGILEDDGLPKNFDILGHQQME